MDRSAVVDGHRTARPLAPADVFGVKAGNFRVGERPGPFSVAIAQREQPTLLTPRINAHWTHFVIHVTKIDTNRQWRIIAVRPKLDVLMPLDLFTAIVPFEVEL